MDTLVKVSIIVPIYNAESYIADTIKMLCKSSLQEIEIIAIDDGSNDKSFQVLQKIAKQDDRIIIVHKENGGIFDARNRGLKEAHGEYVCFCDQDDYVEPEMYEKMYEKAMQEDADIAMCSIGKIAENELKYPSCIIKDKVIEEKDIRETLFYPVIFNKVRKNLLGKKNDIITNVIWKCMIKREFIRDGKIVFRRYVNYEDDRLFLLDVLARAKKVITISNIFYYWRINLYSESHTARYIENFYEKDIQFQDEVIKIMKVAKCENYYEKLFIKNNSAYRYARLVENELNALEKSTHERINSINVIYKESDFKEKIKGASYFPKNMIARKIVCRFLQIHCTAVAYQFWKCYQLIRGKYLNRELWIKAEQFSMGK